MLSGRKHLVDKILSGIRVPDFTDALAGPDCARYMADCAINCLHQAVGVHTLTEGRVELKGVGAFNNDMPSWGIFKGKDGYIAISAATKVGWDRETSSVSTRTNSLSSRNRGLYPMARNSV